MRGRDPHGDGVAGAPTPLLVGRERGRAVLGATLERLVAGHGGTVLVEGEAGIGKSQLLQAAALPAARAAGITVLLGRVFDGTSQRPFGLVTDLLRGQLSPELDELLDPRRNPEPASGELVHRIADATARRVEELAAEAALLVVVEDVHAADDGSLAAVAALVGSTSTVPLALLVTRRPHPEPDVLLTLLDRIGARRGDVVTLGPLGGDEVDRLVEMTLGATPGPRLVGLARQAGGNPLLVTELVRGLRSQDRLVRNGGTVDLVEPVLPASLRSIVRSRLRSMPPNVRSLLRDAAVLGTSFRLEDLATVRGEDALNVVRDIGPAFSAELLMDDGLRAMFRHALVRDAVYEDIASSVRATVHLQAGRRLAAAGASAADVAHHFAHGARAGDHEAVHWLERAAAEAAPRAPSLAAEQLDRALSLAPIESPVTRRLEASLARCLLWSGRLPDAEEVARRILARPGMDGSPEEADARYVLGRVLAYRGHIDQAIDQVEIALRGDGAPGVRRAQLLADLALRRGLFGDLAGADDAGRRALVAGQELADSLTVCTARCARSWSAALRGDTAEAVTLAERAVAQPAPTDPVELVQSRLYLGFARLHAGALTEARHILDDAAGFATRLGTNWGHGLAASLQSFVGYLTGEWDSALELADVAVTAARAGGARTWVPIAAAAGALIAVARDDVVTAQRLITAGWQEVAAAPDIHVGAGLLELACAEVRDLELAGGGVDDLRRSAVARDVAFGAVAHLPLHAIMWAGAGIRTTDAAALLPHLEDLSERSGGALSAAATARCHAAAEGDRGALLTAASVLEPTELRYLYARLAEDAAASEADHEQLHELAEVALGIYRSLGAIRDGDRCRARLRGVGIRPGSRQPRGRPESGPDSLTPAERRVASLVSEGLSNPQIAERLFVSRRTVESHVSSALRKLQLSSRVELAVLATAQARADDTSR